MFTRTATKALIASIAAGVATFAMSPAHAQVESRSKTVYFGDLDISSSAGQATLSRRIATAARQVCGSADVRDIKGNLDVKNCRKEAIASANRGTVQVFADARGARSIAVAKPD
jgi:UrcA family protein